MKTHKTNGQPTKRYVKLLLLQERRQRLDAEFSAWKAEKAARARPVDTVDWTIEHAKECADNIRQLDEILHRNGFCTRDRDCLSCAALLNDRGAA
jgi:hypothetical protein